MPETFGQALRRLRGKMSLRDLACRANCAKSYIFDLENGRRRPSPSVAAALDVALSADGELVGLAGSLEPPSLSDGAEGIFTFDSPHLSTKKAISPPRNVGLKDVSVIREVLHGIAMSDRQFGGGHGRVYATEYLSDVVMPRLHSHAVKEVQRDLFTVSTEFALRVAAMHLDAGSTATSRYLLGAALSMAYEIDDLTLAAWVLARRGEQEIHEAMITCGEAGKHVDQAMAYTGAAVSLASQSPPMARAFIVTKQALSASVAGDRTTALGALAECWRAYEQAGAMEEPPWMKMYGWGHLRHEEARCYYHLGMGADAVRAAEDSMRVRTETRPRAFSLGVQAIGYIQADQDIERACAIGHELVRLADQLGSRRVTIRLGEVLQVLIPYQGQPDVEDLREAAIPVMGRRV